METKICTSCNKELPATAEYFNYKNKKLEKFHSQCKQCRKIKRSKFNKNNTAKLVVEMTKKEKELIKENAYKTGRTISEYTRYVLINNEPIIIMEIEEIEKLESAINELAYQTKKIGNNCNQIAHNLNAMNIVNPKDIKEFSNNYNDLRKENEILIDLIKKLLGKINS